MKKIILLITGLIVHSILYAQVHEIQLEIEHRRSVSDVLKSIEILQDLLLWKNL